MAVGHHQRLSCVYKTVAFVSLSCHLTGLSRVVNTPAASDPTRGFFRPFGNYRPTQQWPQPAKVVESSRHDREKETAMTTTVTDEETRRNDDPQALGRRLPTASS